MSPKARRHVRGDPRRARTARAWPSRRDRGGSNASRATTSGTAPTASWNYELITSAQRVDGGTVDTTADGPVTAISAPVDWGRYRLTVERDGDSRRDQLEFYAGWYVSSPASETPDVLARRARQAGLRSRRHGEAPPRPALRRHRADHRHRRPADRHEGGRSAGRRHHRRSRGHRPVGPRRLRHRHRSTGRWTWRRSACRRARSA